MPVLRLFAAFVAALFLAALPLQAGAQAYEAHLSPEPATAADLCALGPCREVVPGATGFSPRMGQPP
jgi:NosR/NirI family nitrous oxide reductase transcriptional regulator